MKNKYIAIEGIIGAGKTTLSHLLANEYSGKLILEQFEENPFLPLFYNDSERYSFPLEMSFLASRYHQLQEIINSNSIFGYPIIADFVFYKSLVFAANTLSSHELVLYRKLFDIMMRQLPNPNITIYLNISIEKALGNIAKRGREYEKTISEDYLRNIHNSYIQYFLQLQNQTIIILNIDSKDFLNNNEDFLWLKNILLLELKPGIHNF